MANKIVREIIHAKGIDIGIYTKDFENEYISLTDIANIEMIMIPDLLFRTGGETEIQLSFWLFGKNFIIQILTVCNSRRLEVRQD